MPNKIEFKSTMTFLAILFLKSAAFENSVSFMRRYYVMTQSSLSSLSSYNNNNNFNISSNNNNVHLFLPSIAVPHFAISNIIRSKLLQPYYPKCFQGVFPRPKVVRDDVIDVHYLDDDMKERKRQVISKKVIVIDSSFADMNALLSDATTTAITMGMNGEVTPLSASFPGLPESVIRELENVSDLACVGPLVNVTFPRAWLPLETLLTDALPEDAHPPPSGFEEIGHVLHLNLRKQHLPYKYDIGRIVLNKFGESNNRKIRSVVNKVGEVGGPFRTYEFEVIASSTISTNNNNDDDDDFFVTLLEDGLTMQFDMRKVYWCSRLGGERKRLIDVEFQHEQVIADAFCGVGALIVNAAKNLNCSIIANDLNPDAVKYAKGNAERNMIPSEKFHVQCGDARDFIRYLGTNSSKDKSSIPHHLVLNFPLDSCSFLDQLRWWPSEYADGERTTSVHVYTFARADNERSTTDVAIDMVADNLLPEGGYSEQTFFRKKQLDHLGCNVRAHEVRDVAPGKVVICVSFDVTTTLLKHMQGEFLMPRLSYRRFKSKRARMKRLS